MASEKVSRKMVLEIKSVNANTPLYAPKTLNYCWVQKLTWELGFGPNVGWELGFGTPNPLHGPFFFTVRSRICLRRNPIVQSQTLYH